MYTCMYVCVYVVVCTSYVSIDLYIACAWRECVGGVLRCRAMGLCLESRRKMRETEIERRRQQWTWVAVTTGSQAHAKRLRHRRQVGKRWAKEAPESTEGKFRKRQYRCAMLHEVPAATALRKTGRF